MKKYHYIDDQGNVSDALPLAALQKIGLPPATKVLIEGGKLWITLAEATAGGSVPPPPVAAPSIPAKPATIPAQPIESTQHSGQSFWKIFLLALFFGFLGVHRFVVGKTKTGFLQLITFGGLGLWTFVDIVRILLGKFTDGKNQAIANPNPKATWAVFLCVVIPFAMASSEGGGAEERSEKTVWVQESELPAGFDSIEVHISGSTVVASMTVGSKRVWHTGQIWSKEESKISDNTTRLVMHVKMKAELDGVVVNNSLPVILRLNTFSHRDGEILSLEYSFLGASFNYLKKK